MRASTGLLMISLALLGVFAHASSPYETDKVKTGILPTGGFYSLYEVDCSDQLTAAIVSLNGGKRWCTSSDSEMACFYRKQDASRKACGAGAVSPQSKDIWSD